MNKIDRWTIGEILKLFNENEQQLLLSFVSREVPYQRPMVLKLNGKNIVLIYHGSKEKGFCVIESASHGEITETLIGEYLHKQNFDFDKIIPKGLSKDALYNYLFAHLLLKSPRNQGRIRFESFGSAAEALQKASEIITNRNDIYIAAGNPPKGSFFYDLAQTHLNYNKPDSGSNYVQIFLEEDKLGGTSSLIIRNYGQRNDAICVLVANDKQEPTLAKYFKSRGISCSTAKDCAAFLVSIINPNKLVQPYKTREQALQALSTPKDLASGARAEVPLAATLIMPR